MDPLKFLPAELWYNILDFTCQNSEDTASVTKVCRLFHDIVSNLPFLQRLHHHLFPVANFSLRVGCSTQRLNSDWQKDAIQRAKGWKNLFGGGKIPSSVVQGQSFHFDTHGNGFANQDWPLDLATVTGAEVKGFMNIERMNENKKLQSAVHNGKAYILETHLDALQLLIRDLSSGTVITTHPIPAIFKKEPGSEVHLAIGGKCGYIIHEGNILRFDPNNFSDQCLFTTSSRDAPNAQVRIFKVLDDGSLLIGAVDRPFKATRIIRLVPAKNEFDWDVRLNDLPLSFTNMINGEVVCVCQRTEGLSECLYFITDKGIQNKKLEVPRSCGESSRWHRLNEMEFLIVFREERNAVILSQVTGQVRPLKDGKWGVFPEETVHQIELLEKDKICCLISRRTSIIREWMQQDHNPYGGAMGDSYPMRSWKVDAFIRIYDCHTGQKAEWSLPQNFVSNSAKVKWISITISHDTIALSNSLVIDTRSFILRYLHNPEPVVNAPIDQMKPYGMAPIPTKSLRPSKSFHIES